MQENTPNFSGQLEIVQKSAIESISRAEVDMQISTAKRYPRSISQVKSDMISFATLDQETAESCFYSLPRGGKTIQGPSVRLAEIAISCYGNLRAGTRIIETVTTGDSPHVLVQAFCHDLQTNVAICVEKRRRIVGKKSKGGAIDEDDINLAANAGSAIAFRDAVYKVVPGALIRPVYEQAKKVAIGDAKTLADRRSKAIAAFGKMGVQSDRVLSAISRASIEEVTISDLETLIGLHTAIKDGQTSIDESFPAKAVKPNFAQEKPAKIKDSPAAEPVMEEPEKTSPSIALAREIDQSEPPFVGETQKEILAIALRDMSIAQGVFIQGLRLVIPELSKNVTLVAQLPEEIAMQVMEEGLDSVIEAIRAKGGKI